MSPTAQDTVHDEISFNNSFVGLHGDALEDYNENTINEVESLKEGAIKLSKNKARAPYTILLVGETGVGKSSVGTHRQCPCRYYDFDILDRSSEQGGPDNRRQTNALFVYELTSKNGIVVRVLDTPGLADTRDIEQDDLHRQSIATRIKRHVDSISVVLVLANGTVPRGTGLRSMLSTLSTVFPNPLDNNIAFMFTNVANPLSWNLCQDTLPGDFKGARQFRTGNPVALQRKYLKLKDNPNMSQGQICYH